MNGAALFIGYGVVGLFFLIVALAVLVVLWDIFVHGGNVTSGLELSPIELLYDQETETDEWDWPQSPRLAS